MRTVPSTSSFGLAAAALLVAALPVTAAQAAEPAGAAQGASVSVQGLLPPQAGQITWVQSWGGDVLAFTDATSGSGVWALRDGDADGLPDSAAPSGLEVLMQPALLQPPWREAASGRSWNHMVAPDLTGQRRLWRTDGTVSGTAQLAIPGEDTEVGDVAIGADGWAYALVFPRGENGTSFGDHEIWAVPPGGAPAKVDLPVPSDVDGTMVMHYLNPGLGGLIVALHDWSTPQDESRLLVVRNGVATTLAGPGSDAPQFWPLLENTCEPGVLPGFAEDGVMRLWASDGTAAGSGWIFDVANAPVIPEEGLFPVCAGDLTVFTALDGEDRGLWASDGTPAGTREIKALDSLPEDGRSMWAGPGGAWFVLGEAGAGAELWTSDGTVAGTRNVSQFAASAPGVLDTDPVVVDDAVIVVADDGTGPALWQVDSPTSPARRLHALPQGAADIHVRSVAGLAVVAFSVGGVQDTLAVAPALVVSGGDDVGTGDDDGSPATPPGGAGTPDPAPATPPGATPAPQDTQPGTQTGILPGPQPGAAPARAEDVVLKARRSTRRKPVALVLHAPERSRITMRTTLSAGGRTWVLPRTVITRTATATTRLSPAIGRKVFRTLRTVKGPIRVRAQVWVVHDDFGSHKVVHRAKLRPGQFGPAR